MNDEEILVEGLQALLRIIAREFSSAVPKEKEERRKTNDEPIEPERPVFPAEKLVGAQVVADYFDLPRASIWRLTRSGQIPCYKGGRIYRYNLQEVESVLKHQMTAPR